MPLIPPWRWNFWGPWPPEGTGPTQDEIRKRAHILATLNPSRLADENWIKAEKELAEPLPWSSFVRWLGFTEKKGWDWLDFLARLSVPIVIAVGGWYFTSQSTRQQQITNQRVQKDLVVSEYIKSLQNLVLEKNLDNAKPREPVAVIARSLTLTSLTRLKEHAAGHSRHKAQILQFLAEASLINSEDQHVDLHNADLAKADLSGADLGRTNLSQVVLSEVDLNGAILTDAQLIGADLSGANLHRAILNRADLTRAKLIRAKLINAKLLKADFSGKNLEGPIINGVRFISGKRAVAYYRSGAHLSGADLSGADLSGADLRGAELSKAELSGADLKDVNWDGTTRWPGPESFKDTKNIPPDLKKQLGL